MKITLYILSFLLLASCSIEKRKHRKGYNIQWTANYKKLAVSPPQKTFETLASKKISKRLQKKHFLKNTL